jgi:uncharacterized protein
VRAPRHWFLPESPDVLALLRRQVAVTIDGIDAFSAWAAGDDDAGRTVRKLEHRADDVKRELQGELRDAFVTPLEPEDLFALSRAVDRILDEAKDLVRESEVMSCPPDPPVAEMAALLADSVRALGDAIAQLGPGRGDSTEAVDAAIKLDRRIERVDRAAMAQLLAVDDLRLVMARRELYRRCSRMAEASEEVAERVLYAVVKES